MPRFIADEDLLLLQREGKTLKLTGENFNKHLYYYLYGPDGESSPFVLTSGDDMDGDLVMSDTSSIKSVNLDSGRDTVLRIKHNGETKLYVESDQFRIATQAQLDTEGTEDNHLITKNYVDNVSERVDNNLTSIENINESITNLKINAIGTDFKYSLEGVTAAGNPPEKGCLYGADVDENITTDLTAITTFVASEFDGFNVPYPWAPLGIGDFIQVFDATLDTDVYGFYKITANPSHFKSGYYVLPVEFVTGNGQTVDGNKLKLRSSKGGAIGIQEAERLFVNRSGDEVSGKLTINNIGRQGTHSLDIHGFKPGSDTKESVFNVKDTNNGTEICYYGAIDSGYSITNRNFVTRTVADAPYLPLIGGKINGDVVIGNENVDRIKFSDDGEIDIYGLGHLNFDTDLEGHIKYRGVDKIILTSDTLTIDSELSMMGTNNSISNKITNLQRGENPNDAVTLAQLEERFNPAGQTMTGNLIIDASKGGGNEATITLKGNRTTNSNSTGTIKFANLASTVDGYITFRSDNTNQKGNSYFKVNHQLKVDNKLHVNEIQTYSGNNLDILTYSRFKGGFVVKETGARIDGDNIFVAKPDQVRTYENVTSNTHGCTVVPKWYLDNVTSEISDRVDALECIDDSLFLEKSGGTMTGTLSMKDANAIKTRHLDSGQNSTLNIKHNGQTKLYVGSNLFTIQTQAKLNTQGTDDTHLVNKKYIDDADKSLALRITALEEDGTTVEVDTSTLVKKSGDTMTGSLRFASNKYISPSSSSGTMYLSPHTSTLGDDSKTWIALKNSSIELNKVTLKNGGSLSGDFSGTKNFTGTTRLKGATYISYGSSDRLYAAVSRGSQSDSVGSPGQVLTSDGDNGRVYWANASGGGYQISKSGSQYYIS